MTIAMLLKHAVPGAAKSVGDHIARGEQIARAIQERFSISEPRQWQVKHLRWVLERWCVERKHSESRRYDMWRTVRVLTAALGRWKDWEPHLKGPWCRKGVGGRQAKLPKGTSR